MSYVTSPNGRLKCLRIPYNPNGWISTLSAFHRAHPVIKHALLDECQCINVTLLDTFCMLIRDFYPNVPIIFTSIDYDSWHHKLPQISALIQLVQQSHHLNHRCMLCHRIATRRLHVVNHKPCYNSKKYDHILHHHLYKPNARPMMYSVCSRHYRHLPNNFEHILYRKLHPVETNQQMRQRIHKKLGLN